MCFCPEFFAVTVIAPPPLLFPGTLAMIQEKMEILDELRLNFILKLKKDLNILYDS